MTGFLPLDLVMLVDDDPDENFVNRRIITRHNLARAVLDFENPVEAIDYLSDTSNPSVNLIVLDINMPEMDGFTFLERHRALPPECRADAVIMLLTTSLNERDMARARLFGHIDYRNKPLTPEMLVETLEKTIRTRPGGS